MRTERPTCRECACDKVCEYFKNENNRNLDEICPLCYWEKYFVPKTEWISVDERLPEEDGWYITYTNANGKDNGVIAQRLVTTTIKGKKTRRWEWQTRVSPWIVTHWMPLPEPPRTPKERGVDK